jgi:hypothetical protein
MVKDQDDGGYTAFWEENMSVIAEGVSVEAALESLADAYHDIIMNSVVKIIGEK